MKEVDEITFWRIVYYDNRQADLIFKRYEYLNYLADGILVGWIRHDDNTDTYAYFIKEDK